MMERWAGSLKDRARRSSAEIINRAATQAEQETGTAVDKIVTPGRQQYHPSACKCWGQASYSGGVPTLDVSYNMTSITDAGTGNLDVTIATDFSVDLYATLATSMNVAVGGGNLIEETSIESGSSTAGAITLRHYVATAAGDTTKAASDPINFNWAFFGDQA